MKKIKFVIALIACVVLIGTNFIFTSNNNNNVNNLSLRDIVFGSTANAELTRIDYKPVFGGPGKSCCQLGMVGCVGSPC